MSGGGGFMPGEMNSPAGPKVSIISILFYVNSPESSRQEHAQGI